MEPSTLTPRLRDGVSREMMAPGNRVLSSSTRLYSCGMNMPVLSLFLLMLGTRPAWCSEMMPMRAHSKAREPGGPMAYWSSM